MITAVFNMGVVYLPGPLVHLFQSRLNFSQALGPGCIGLFYSAFSV